MELLIVVEKEAEKDSVFLLLVSTT